MSERGGLKQGDGKVSPATFEEAARERASGGEAAGDDATLDSYFLFRLGSTRLALPASTVESVADIGAPMRVPLTPPHVLGLVLHGEIALTIVDLVAFFGLEADHEVERDGDTRRVIVVRHGEMLVGLSCHRAAGVFAVKRSLRSPAEVLKGGRLRTYLAAELEMPDGRVGVLDLARFIEDARVRPSRDDPRG